MRPNFNNSLFSSLHPITLLGLFIVLLFASALFTNPLYLIVLFVGIIALICLAGTLSQWKFYALPSLILAGFIIVINVFFSRSGTTIIYSSQHIPVIGVISISLEAFIFGCTMGLKLFLITTVFFFYCTCVDQDKALSFFSRFSPKTALTAIMTSFLFPKLKQDINTIKQVLYTRGVDIQKGPFFKRLKKRYPMLKILLLSSLENSWDTAEALHARAFGSGKRTSYFKNTWQSSDTIVSLIVIVLFVFLLTCLVTGKGFYQFYPRLSSFIHKSDLTGLVPLLVLLILLLFYAWSWRKWRYSP